MLLYWISPTEVYLQQCYCLKLSFIFIPPPNEVGGGYTGITLSVCLSVCPSVCLSVCPSVCRWHGFRIVTRVCFGISIWNFICMLLVAMGRSLLIFSDVTFKMAAWWPSWIFRFPNSNFSLALNFKSKLMQHISCMYWWIESLWFWRMFNCNPCIVHWYPFPLGGGILVDHWSTVSSYTCFALTSAKQLGSFWLQSDFQCGKKPQKTVRFFFTIEFPLLTLVPGGYTCNYDV